MSERVHIKKQGFLIRPGESNGGTFLVRKGVLRTYKVDAKGKEHILLFAAEGWIIGDIECQIKGQSSGVHVQAIDPSTPDTMSDSTPKRAGDFPDMQTLEEGKTYAWCSCGHSSNQPWCNGAHSGSSLAPKVFQAEKSGPAAMCLCKQTKNPPFCDGSHAA